MVEDFKLRVFVEVASEGSFTKAAHKLGVSQPAISQNIADLEKNLNTKLFERLRGEVLLTDAGKTFLQYANNILYWYKAVDNMFGSVTVSSFSKVLTIAADSFVGECILPSVLSAINSSNAKSKFNIVPVESESDVKIFIKLRTDALDFDSADNLITIIPATMFGSSLTVQSIDSGKVNLDDAPICCFGLFKEALPLDLRSRVVCYSDSLPLIRQMVLSSDRMVGILPSMAIDSDWQDSLKKIDYRLPFLQSDLYIVGSEHFRETVTFNQLKKILADSLI